MTRLILICALFSYAFSREVRIRQGIIRGLEEDTEYGRVSSFLGIPFAQPPVGQLRFEAPRPPLPSSSVYNATKLSAVCPGIKPVFGGNITISFGEPDEDCLYLNVWAPANASNLPIVVYMHGGSFVTGSGNFFWYDGTRLAPRSNIVYVTINHRLGALGFLQHPALPETNVGMLDMVSALQWVRENAGAFGGNINEVTLWGQSAGAMAIDILLKTNAIDGLARRVILQGGTAGTAGFLLHADGPYASQQLMYSLGCDPQGVHEELLRCLREFSWQEIMSKLSSASVVDLISIVPHVDNKLIFKDVADSPRITDSVEDILILNDELEALPFITLFFKTMHNTENISSTEWRTTILVIYKLLLHISYRDTKAMLRHYISRDIMDADNFDEATEIEFTKALGSMMTDPIFFCPAEFRATAVSHKGVRTYRGEFHFRPDYSYQPPWGSMTHGEEIALLHSNLDLYKPGKGLTGKMLDCFVNRSRKDERFADTMIKFFADFFHGRKLRIPGSEKDWPLYTKASPQIVYMAPNNFTIVNGPKSDKCGLWEPYIGSSPKEEAAPTTSAPLVTRSTTESIGENIIRRGKVLRRTQIRSASDIVSAQLSVVLLFCSLVYFRLNSLT